METTERLGFAAGATVAVVHADDIGMSHAANIGAFAALDAGPATCGSVMVPCPWSSEAAAMAQASPDVDLGVHLTLNAEFDGYRWGPVAGRTAVPSLVDEAGHLYRTSREGTVALVDRGTRFIAFDGRRSVRSLRRVHRKLPPAEAAYDGLRRQVRSDPAAGSE